MYYWKLVHFSRSDMYLIWGRFVLSNYAVVFKKLSPFEQVWLLGSFSAFRFLRALSWWIANV
jgi:hypothetical protein